MRQEWGRPFGLIVDVMVTFGGGEALVGGEVGRLILRYAQNDKATRVDCPEHEGNGKRGFLYT